MCTTTLAVVVGVAVVVVVVTVVGCSYCSKLSDFGQCASILRSDEAAHPLVHVIRVPRLNSCNALVFLCAQYSPARLTTNRMLSARGGEMMK